MQELFLFGQVEDTRHNQLLAILAGLTASKPSISLERHVVFKPVKTSSQDVFKGGQQTVGKAGQATTTAGKESFHMQLVKNLKPNDFGRAVDVTEARTGYTQRFYDTPEPVPRPVGLRTVRDVSLISEDPMKSMRASGYTYINQYIIGGHEFVINNTVLFVNRIRKFPDPTPSSLDTPLPQLEQMPLVDQSGSWLVQVSLNVVDGASPKLVKDAMSEVLGVQERLRGIVKLVTPDRLSMDTRAK